VWSSGRSCWCPRTVPRGWSTLCRRRWGSTARRGPFDRGMLETGSSSRSKPTTTNAYVDSRFVISKTRRSTSGMMTSNFWASAQPILRWLGPFDLADGGSILVLARPVAAGRGASHNRSQAETVQPRGLILVLRAAWRFRARANASAYSFLNSWISKRGSRGRPDRGELVCAVSHRVSRTRAAATAPSTATCAGAWFTRAYRLRCLQCPQPSSIHAYPLNFMKARGTGIQRSPAWLETCTSLPASRRSERPRSHAAGRIGYSRIGYRWWQRSRWIPVLGY